MQFWEPNKNCDMGCQEILNTKHLLSCLALKKDETEIKYENILEGTMKQKVTILEKIQEVLETKKQLTNSGIQ